MIDKAKSPIDGLEPAKISNIKRVKLRTPDVAINNDFGLEKEADAMGRAASSDLTLEKEAITQNQNRPLVKSNRATEV